MKANTTAQGILLFWLSAGRRFAIGTLKVKEIVPYTPLTAMPQPHPAVLGAASIRGGTIPVVDMSAAMGLKPLTPQEREAGFIVVSDCQRKRVGFLVRALDRIVDRDWRDIEAPPKHLGKSAFTAGVTRVDEELVQVVDLELIYANIYGQETVESNTELADGDVQTLKNLNILMVDDSAVARRQLADALNALGIDYRMTANGQEALDIMTAEADAGHPVDLLVSDIEMPGLDGYELAFGVRDKPALAGAYIILHTSISSEISVSQAHQVGANEALTKFDVDELIQAMLRGARHDASS